MIDAEIEAPELKEEQKIVPNSSNDNVCEPKVDQSNDKSGNGSAKAGNKRKRKNDGRAKKRQWEFNRRDDSVKRERTDPADRIKRRKYILVLGYAGAKYVGMQRNPDVNTIEEELLKAFFKNKLITEEGFNQPQFTFFQRAARTDKGVSAARQCISLKLREFFFNLFFNVSTIFGIEINRFSICFFSAEQIDLESLNNDLPSDIKVFGFKRVTKGFNCKEQCDARTYSYTLPSVSFAPADQKADMKTYRIDDATLARVNEALQLFGGTKNFHNFTSRKKYEDPSARRFIMNFRCEPPFMVDDVEFCMIIVKGQSFMMHQIRKMIGLTLAVVRGITDIETINRSFDKTRIDIPMAPGLGLVLDQVHYDGYNARFKDDGLHEQLEWDECEPAIQEFRDKFIHPVIKETELNEQPMIKWLETLPIHTYDDRQQNIARNNQQISNENAMDEDGKIEMAPEEETENLAGDSD